MKHTAAISITFLLASCIGGGWGLLALGCKYKADKTAIKDTARLRMAIVKSIQVPFTGADTLILSPVHMDTGKAAVVYISTQLENGSLAKALGLTVITEEDFLAQMISAPENGQLHCSFSPGVLDTCIKHKITASIWAEKLEATGNILVHETYLLGDSLKSFVKEFAENPNGNWTYTIRQ